MDFESEALAAARMPSRRESDPAAEGSSAASLAPDARALLQLQRTAGNAGVVQLLADEADEPGQARSPVHDVVGRGGGSSLDDSTRTAMETRFGTDFGDVRVHTDAGASRSAEAVGANAYTVGSDIVFRAGHFDPGTPAGQRTLAHELTHVVQQRTGPVDGSDAPGGIRISDPGDRFERAADRHAEAVMASAAPSSAPPVPSSAPTVQAEQDETEEGINLQREVGDELEEEEDQEVGA